MIDQQQIESSKQSSIDIPESPSSPSPTTVVDNEPYCILTKKKLITMLIICSLSGMLSPLTANIYFPALIDIQKDLHTTNELVNLSVTVYLIFQGLSPAFWGSLADLWGRRPVYLMTVFIFCLSCIGLALVNNYGLLLFLRMVQAFGSSSLIAVGAGVVGDVAEPSKRAGYYGVYATGQLMGPVIGPLVGGLVAGTIGWRWIFWVLFIFAATMLIFVFLFVPETLRALVGNGSGYANPTPTQWIERHRGEKQEQQQQLKSTHLSSRFTQCPNFLAPFTYLLQLDVLMALLFVGVFYSSFYCSLTAATNLLHDHYGLTTIQIGLCFIPQGFGGVIGSFAAGKILDRSFAKALDQYKASHPGVLVDRARIPLDFPIYHARLRPGWPFFLLSNCATVVYGWLFHANVHLALPLIFQTIMGFTMVFALNGTQTLLVDLFPGRGASITASNNLVRCIMAAVTTVVVDPGIRGVGVGWFFTIIGIITFCFDGVYLLLLKTGNHYRRKRYDKNLAAQQQVK